MSVILKLKEMKNSFTKNEKKISEYILNNYNNNINSLNTIQIAKKCDVSQASVVRFSKKIGCKGFPEFKILLIKELENIRATSIDNNKNEEIKTTDTVETISNKIINDNMKALNDTLKLCDFNEVEKAIKSLINADKIMVAGIGFSSIPARDFYYKLIEIGKNAVIELDTHIQLSYISTMSSNDVLFVISHSGKTIEMYNLVKLAKNRGIKIISMTTIDENPIREISDINLNTVAVDNKFRESAFSPRISQLTLIDILYAKLTMNSLKSQNYIQNAVEMVQGFKIK